MIHIDNPHKIASKLPAITPRSIVNSWTTNKEDIMEKYIYNEKNGLHYELVGDYYLPCLTIDEPEQPIGIWGQRRSHFL